mmetsp:Transcript_20211/g.60541  ORF Transcript_20211/g.60541 Transcript_20211/m.60541 type:complete len:203 (-) Transcript_20211:631-1239(-)
MLPRPLLRDRVAFKQARDRIAARCDIMMGVAMPCWKHLAMLARDVEVIASIEDRNVASVRLEEARESLSQRVLDQVATQALPQAASGVGELRPSSVGEEWRFGVVARYRRHRVAGDGRLIRHDQTYDIVHLSPVVPCNGHIIGEPGLILDVLVRWSLRAFVSVQKVTQQHVLHLFRNREEVRRIARQHGCIRGVASIRQKHR